MELPELEGRKAILTVHLRKVRHEDIDLDIVARATAGSSGAELANIINEGALRAVRMGRDSVTTEDLEESVETVMAGAQKKGKVLSDPDKKIVAYHETGHALVAAVLGGTTGASNDIEQATRIARAMVTRYGMSSQYDIMELETQDSRYLGGDTSLACSADTAAEVDKVVLQMIKEAHEKARSIISANLDVMHEAAGFLMEKETITGEEFMEILDRKKKI